jgi:glycine/D-amino acid oxidase-like deaminating enzyme
MWGGYDAIYHYGSRIHPALDARPETFEKLARQFFETFPQLEGLRFSHAWGGAIDTCSRFFAFWGTALRGRVAYVLGYTGMGVAEARFGARGLSRPALGAEDRAHASSSSSGRSRCPSLPSRCGAGAIELTRRSLARADERDGRRDLWLRTLDRFGLGFDS